MSTHDGTTTNLASVAACDSAESSSKHDRDTVILETACHSPGGVQVYRSARLRWIVARTPATARDRPQPGGDQGH